MSAVQMKGQSDREEKLLLDYAAKVHSGLRDTGARINRALVLQTTFSLSLLAVASEFATKPEMISLAGLQIRLPLPALLASLSSCLACLLMYQIGLVNHEEKLLEIVEGIYQSLGFTHKSMAHRLSHPLETAGVVTTILAISGSRKSPGLTYRASQIFVVLLFVGLPIAIQVLVIYKLVQMKSLAWASPAILSLLLSLWLLLQYVRR